ncbi:MAG TPA: glycosyltransferase family 2 protein [Bacteroidales bacterium]|mgnify:CR=1 FL=1|nr:glycosyltransferase family 2 protein [Bacteroidales bacterium]
MITFFFICIINLIYIYFGYPVLILVLSLIAGRTVEKASYEPMVTILISAYNEEKHIGATIENKLSLNYPRRKLEIIVISDGSEDRTDEIVRSFEDQGVIFLRQEPRNGKTSALNLAVSHARGEILVFSDANSIYDHDALRYLIENFDDPGVGYVTGKMVYVNSDGTTIGDGCTAYMKYENQLRVYETRLGSIVGVDGGIDAVRRELYRPMKADQLPDFVLPLMVVEQGYRVVYESRALLKEETLKGSEDEYRMRVRVSLRALWALWDMRKLLNPRRYGLYSFQLLSHKILRYLAILFMIGSFVSNVLILKKARLYQILFIIQVLFYGASIAGHMLEKRGLSSRMFYIPYYFCLINGAAGHALIRFLRGEKQVMWAPRKG